MKQKQEVTVIFAAGLLPVAGAAVSLAWFNRLPMNPKVAIWRSD